MTSGLPRDMGRALGRQNRTALRLHLPALVTLGVWISLASLVSAEAAQPPLPDLSQTTQAAATYAPTAASPLLGGAGTTLAQAEATEGTTAEGAAAVPSDDEPLPLRPTGDETLGAEGSGDELGVDIAPPALAPDAGPPSDIRPGTFTLEARLAVDGPPLGDGVKWRIFGDTPGTDGHLPLLGEADGGIIYIRLDQGIYYVHAAYGRAGATRKIEVNGPTGGEVLVLNAGGMRLIAINGTDQTLRQGEVAFDIYAPDEGGSEERYLLIPNAPPGRVIPLNAGVYHVVSKYGEENAIVRADVKIDPGKLTEATVFQKAARLTLKLVEQHGGEAIADTAWSVVTATGESVVESVGAFPSVVLAEGDYTAIAKHDDRRFETNFTVRAGANRDIEVLAE